MRQSFGRGQTTIEYLLLISVVVLLFVGVLVTVNSLREEANKNVNVSGKDETPSQAIATQLGELRDIAGASGEGSGPSGGAAQQTELFIAFSDSLPCTTVPLTVTISNAGGKVAGANVTLSRGSNVVDSKLTQSDGTAVFVPSSFGTYTMSATAQPNQVGSSQFTVAC